MNRQETSTRAVVAMAVALVAAAGAASAQQLAFPGAEGAGAFATGGRNGDVYVVTNLDDSGRGSLRHAIDTAPQNGRMIVFGVGGTINLQSDLRIDSPNITIAGQSAPAGGVTLARRALRVSDTHDVIIQHIAVRPGDYYTAPNVYEPDSIWVSGSEDVILDHVSASWGTDEQLSVTHGSTNITVQWSLITEALHNSNHSKGNHGYGSIIHGGETTLHHNLYANNRSRNPATGNWDKSSPITPAHLDIVNNVISNPGDRYSYSGGDDQYQVNWAGNFGVEGPDTSRENELFRPGNVNTIVYYDGNYYDSSADGLLQLSTAAPGTLTGTYTPSATPIATTNPPAMTSAPMAYTQVLSYAGASAWRDPIDRRVVYDVLNQSGRHIDSQDDVGGWHYPSPGSHQLDPDGLPDAWKSANGFDPNDNTVGLQVAPDGYTYLEKYLHELNAGYLPRADAGELTISTATGDGADASVGEVAGAAVGDGGSGQLRASWLAGQHDELIALRFDLSGVEPGSVESAELQLTAYAAMGRETMYAYGLKHELPGQDWDEAAVDYASAPGVQHDPGDPARDLATDDLVLLGAFSTSAAEGGTLGFTNPDLAVFLNLLSYRDSDDATATILLQRQTDHSSVTLIASKEADQLASGGAAQPGAYAPRLLLTAVAAEAAGLAGDYNNDGLVDAADYTVWRDALGGALPLPNETASPGVVDQADYDAWRANFGQTQGGPAAHQTPEPLASGAACLLLAAATGRRSRPARRRPAGWLVVLAGVLAVAPLPASAGPADGGEGDPWSRASEILSRIVPPSFPAHSLLVTDFGADETGAQDCTVAFRQAIDACVEAGGGRVTVPAGRFKTGPIHLRSNVELHLSDDAEIVFSDRFEDYLPPVLVRVGGVEVYNYSPLIYARDCVNVAVTGRGTLNGNGKAWWQWARRETREHFEQGERGVPVDQRVFGDREHRIRPSFVCLLNCRNVLLDDFTITSGPNWTIHPVYCRNTTIRGVKVLTEGPNNDGIDPDSCVDMLIEDCLFDTGDDCVVLKSGYNRDGWRVGKPTENFVMRRCFSKRGHGGLVIGSEMSGDVRNVFMEDCQLEGTDHAVRIKSRADRGGVVEDVYVRNLRVSDMQRDVVILNMAYAADKSEIASAAPPVFRNMRFEKIIADGAPVGVVLRGMPGSPLRNLRFQDMTLTCQRGVVATHVESIRFDRVTINSEAVPAYELQDARGVSISGVDLAGRPTPYVRIAGGHASGVSVDAPHGGEHAKIIETIGELP